MGNKKLTLALLASFLALGNAQAQTNTATNATKATAQLVASCQITAQSVSFGSLNLPLTTQTATSNLNVLCNKSASYTIDMTYGGIYGQSYPGSTVYRLAYQACNATTTMFNVFDVLTGKSLGTSCGIPSNVTVVSGPDGWYTGAPINFNFGKMIGASKGDNVAYSIEVPGKPGVVWNTANKYTAIGSGVVDSIPVKASIVPAQSGSNYPIPDMYTDTVTAKVTF